MTSPVTRGGQVAVLDLDGTLVDSVYVHVLAWQAAFRDVGVHVPAHRLHGLIGMGGDRLVAAAAGDATEHALGDELRRRHPEHVDHLFAAIVPTEGAVDLLEALREHDVDVRLASSSDQAMTERLLGVLEGAERLLGRVVSGSEAEQSKPSGRLVEVALEGVDAATAVVVGDAVWDVLAAQDAGVPCLGLLTGGTPAADLLAAGAVAVHDDPRALAEHLRRTGSLLPA